MAQQHGPMTMMTMMRRAWQLSDDSGKHIQFENTSQIGESQKWQMESNVKKNEDRCGEAPTCKHIGRGATH
jgi:hypothetical protein